MRSETVLKVVRGEPPLHVLIASATGQNLAKCYQCGKCSAGCPMAGETPFRPHDIMRMVLRDQRARLLADDSIWLCLTCETCTARCPNGLDPARVVDALRELSMAEAPGRIPKAIAAFHRSFLEEVKRTGRMGEFGLVLRYKLRTGQFMKDVGAVPSMVRRGKLKPLAPSIKGVKGVRRIFEKCVEARRANGQEGVRP
jgi:heterodisulfide reductase subunit C2